MAPETFKAVRVMNAINPLLSRMRDNPMFVTSHGERPVRMPFVAADRRAGADFLKNDCLKGCATDVGDNTGYHVATTLQHSENDSLTCRSPTMLTGSLAADVDLIDLNMPGKIVITVNVGHVLADFVTDAPRRLVGHPKLALQFFRGYAVPGRGEQVHRVEPLLQRRPRVLERRPSHRMDVMAAPRAGIGGQLRQSHEPTFLSAFWAIKCLAVARFHQVREAAIVVRKPFEKVLYGELLSHRTLHLEGI